MIEQLERRPALRLVVLAVAATMLASLPLLGIVLNWYETFFHELSHGLMALLTGGSVLRMELNLDGSGLLKSSGSFLPALVTFVGYPGTVLSGIALYLAIEQGGTGKNRELAHNLALGLALIIGLSALLWMRDLVSLFIALLLAGLLVAAWRWGRAGITLWLARLVAIHLVLGGVGAIWSLPGHRGHNDAAALAETFFLPAFLFVLLWLTMSLAAIYWLWRRETRRGSRR